MFRSRLTAWFLSGSMASVLAEWLVIVVLAYVYAGPTLLDFDPNSLQQTGEHGESATLLLLTELGLWRYGEIPLWNAYMLTGFPHAGDPVNHFWNPVSTLSVLAFGGIDGMKVSVFVSFVLAGMGQWLFAHVLGLRGIVRLWVAIMFMISGGLGLLWRVGWYGLFLGTVWFPWCFASTWWALRRRDRPSIVCAVGCAALLITTGSAYNQLYLFVSLGVLVGVGVACAPSGQRWSQVRRAAAIAGLSAGLVAVSVLPWVDAARLAGREAAPDPQQRGSQPISYALINYVVSQPEWFRTEILGTQGGWNWFYIGPLPLALAALGLLALRDRQLRVPVVLTATLTLLFLVWHANRHTPVQYIYDALPFLYWFRFPGRLLIIAACPLLVLAGVGVQHLLDLCVSFGRRYGLTILLEGRPVPSLRLSLALALSFGVFAALFLSSYDTFVVNKAFTFSPGRLEQKSFTALRWLKTYDASTYYTNMGGGSIIWSWTPAAYLLEMPIINFKYNRSLANYDAQRSPGSPLFAKPKYMLAAHNQPRPPSAQLLRDFEGIGLWYLPDALPFAFRVPSGRMALGRPLAPEEVSAAHVALSPNRVQVRAASEGDDVLVVLVSDYPGWSLYVDGKPAPHVPANGYLSAPMERGEHTYQFVFFPTLYAVGVAVSLATALVIVGLLVYEALGRLAVRRAGAAGNGLTGVSPESSAGR